MKKHKSKVGINIVMRASLARDLNDYAAATSQALDRIVTIAIENYLSLHAIQTVDVIHAVQAADSGIFASEEEVQEKFQRWYRQRIVLSRLRWVPAVLQALDKDFSYLSTANPVIAQDVFQHLSTALRKLNEGYMVSKAGSVSGTREIYVIDAGYAIVFRQKKEIQILGINHI